MKLKIGGMIYVIEKATGITMDEIKRDGVVDWGASMILIEEKNMKMSRQLTLVHEIVHVISEERQASLDERTVEIFSYGLLDVIKHNDLKKMLEKI